MFTTHVHDEIKEEHILKSTSTGINPAVRWAVLCSALYFNYETKLIHLSIRYCILDVPGGYIDASRPLTSPSAVEDNNVPCIGEKRSTLRCYASITMKNCNRVCELKSSRHASENILLLEKNKNRSMMIPLLRVKRTRLNHCIYEATLCYSSCWAANSLNTCSNDVWHRAYSPMLTASRFICLFLVQTIVGQKSS